MERELNKAEIEQLDFVDNTCYNFICELAGVDPASEKIEWDMEWIGEVAELAQEIICDKLKLMTEMEFRPYIELEVKHGEK